MGINLGSAYGEIVIGTGGATESVQSLSQQLRSVGQTMSLAVSAPLIAVGAAAITSASGFEQSMDIIAQVSGATGDQMDALRGQALQLGADTSFSAGEAADGMLELAKAGMTASQTGDAIAGVMDLAAAGGLGLADAATITANAINAFGLQASDASSVANTFAAAANASSADVGNLARGFQMAGAVFSSNGQTVDDLAASLAILANNGIAGSDAGTSLKTMMMRLAAPTDEAAAQIQQLGLNVYDAQGAMLPFGDIVGGLETATQGMSDAQRNAALSTIFGADAIRAATILAGEGSATFDKMRGAVQKQGAAADVAGARMQGFRGAIEYLKGSIDSFLIGTALPFLDTGGALLRWVGDAITGFGNLSEPVKNAALAFAAVLAAAGPIMLAISGVVAVIGALTSPIGLVVLALAGLAAAWASDWGGIREKTAAAWSAIQPYLMQAWTWFQGQLPAALSVLQGGFSAAWTAISGAVSAAWNVVAPLLAQAWTWLQTVLPSAVTTLQTGMATAWTTISGAVSTAWAVIQPMWTTVQTWLQTNLPTAVNMLQTAWAAAWPALQSAVATAWAAIQTTWTTIQTWLQTNLPTAVSGLQTAWATAWPALQSAVDTAWTGMQTAWTGMQTWLQTNLPTAATNLQTTFTSVWTALPGVVSTAQEGMATAFTAIQTAWQTLESFFGPAIDRIKQAFSGLSTQIDPIKTSLSGLITAFQSLWTALQPILLQLGMVLGAVFGVVGLTLLNGFSAAISAIGPVVTAVVDQITLTINTIAGILTAATALVKAVIDGDWTTAWQSAQTIGESAVNYLSTTWENFSTAIGTIMTAIYDTVIDTLTDLGVDAQALVDSIKSWWSDKFGAMQGIVDGVVGAIQGLWDKVSAFAAWIGSVHIPNPFAGLHVPGFASGTSYSPGGLVEVGERGREFIIPPAGSKVLTNGQSNRLADSAQGSKSYNITVNGVQLRTDLDGERLGYRLAGLIAAAG